MKTTATFQLIDSEFSYDDAKELLMELIKQKINFHKVKNFTSVIRYDETDTDSLEKVKTLINTRNSISEFIETAKKEGKNVSIFSELKLTIK